MSDAMQASGHDRSDRPEPVAPTIAGKYLSLTTFRRDGTGVATPVWFVEDGGRLLVETDGASYKVKRMRSNPSVTIAACNARGRLRGPVLAAHAEIRSDPELAQAKRLFGQKYRIDIMLIKPIRWVQTRRHVGRPRGASVLVAISAD